MKRIESVKHPLHGDITVPGDKSIAHRAVIFGSIANGPTRIFNLSGGDDNSRTVRSFRQLGVAIGRDGDALCIDGTCSFPTGTAGADGAGGANAGGSGGVSTGETAAAGAAEAGEGGAVAK